MEPEMFANMGAFGVAAFLLHRQLERAVRSVEKIADRLSRLEERLAAAPRVKPGDSDAPPVA